MKSAAALITQAKTRTGGPPTPSAKALAELRLVLAHNDTCSGNTHRVSADAAVELLRAHGWLGTSRRALDAVCRGIGRHSYGTP